MSPLHAADGRSPNAAGGKGKGKGDGKGKGKGKGTPPTVHAIAHRARSNRGLARTPPSAFVLRGPSVLRTLDPLLSRASRIRVRPRRLRRTLTRRCCPGAGGKGKGGKGKGK